ncbi:MAG: response regulator transcription factor [Oscillospiraceae bacterium]|nr:response regulator transcription factor [Oscillospiraceae bacterium]
MDKKILVVEDEKAIADILEFNLKKEGYKVVCAYDGEDGLTAALKQTPDLILLDVMLPKLDGFEVCKNVRKTSNVPIIMLTAREEEVDKVLGLELGADDYITKPFSMRELMARIKANVRRSSAPVSESADASDENRLVFGNIVINLKSLDVKKNGEKIDLTPREFDLIKFLATQPNQVFSREALMENVWQYDYYGDLRTVDVTVRRLREKIEDDPANPQRIVTRRGAGYMFAD